MKYKYGKYKSLRRCLLAVLPDFCWQTCLEVVTFSEQVNEDVDYRLVITILCNLAREGLIDRRRVVRANRGKGRLTVYQYKGKDLRA